MRRTRLPLNTVLTVLLIVATWTMVGVVSIWHQPISDWRRLRGYSAPPEIAAIADNNQFTDSARRLFYVYYPEVEDASEFNENCTLNTEYTIILGCYVSGQGIYVYKVEDARLDGIEEVTSAHEMLHVAYERLKSSERKKVDAQLADVYAKMTNDRLKATVDQYRKNDPSVVPNELHSILGTELRVLTPELETYYSKYFKDRSAVVGYSETYEKAFSDRKAQIDSLEIQLKSLQDQANSRTAELDKVAVQLALEYQALETYRNRVSIEVFNARARAYNNRVIVYNREVSSISTIIDTYNEVYTQYQQLVVERQGLYKAISSRPETLPSQ